MCKALSALMLLVILVAGCGDNGAGPDEADWLDGAVKWTNGHTYLAVLAPGVSWDNAQAQCEAHGGYLVTITSAEENTFVYSLVSGNSSFWVVDAYSNALGPWLGGYQPDGSAEPDGGWRWVTTEPFAYTNWEVGQPDEGGGGSQNRLRFFKLGAAMGDRWDDGEADNPASHRRGFIFEMD